MKKLAQLSIILFWVITPFISFSQTSYPKPPIIDLGIPTGPSIGPAQDIEILNYDQEYSVKFNLSTDGKDWYSFELTGNGSKEYDLGGSETVVIKICTGNLSNCRYYELDKGKRYAAYRDESRSVWDISTLKF